MRKILFLCCFVLLTPCLLSHALAQDTGKAPESVKSSEAAGTPEPPAHYYHLKYVLQEIGNDGKPANSRTYSTIIGDRSQRFSAIRTGSRVPIITGALHGPTGDANQAKLEFQYQYLDVGVSIDTENVHEIGGQLAAYVKAEISSLADSGPSNANGLVNDPVIRQNMWQAPILIPIGKPTVIFSSDALDSKGGMQLVVTATALP